MRRKDPRYNEYLKRRIQGMEKRRCRKHHTLHDPHAAFCNHYDGFHRVTEKNQNVVIADLPEDFSIVDNSEETISFFNNLSKMISSGSNDKIIKFNFHPIRHITIDALMYLIAIMKNSNPFSRFVKGYRGDYPKEHAAYRLFVQSGFLNFVKSSLRPIKPDTSCVQIFYDTRSDIKAPARISDFLTEKTGIAQCRFSYLYNMIMELETNTGEHAYTRGKNTFENKNWYAYADESEDAFRFTFLDTGKGMGNTMRRMWHEYLPFCSNDVERIISAFSGELMRSSTGRTTRGKGLPKIKSYADSGVITRLTVVTNKAFCHIDDTRDHKMSGIKLENSLRGTLYYWEIPKSKLNQAERETA